MNSLRTGLLAVLVGTLVGCTLPLHDPVPRDSPAGRLDLSDWDFVKQGPVIPLGWLWDANVLWSPLSGRPELPPAVAAGPLDRGGVLTALLGASGGVAKATARLTVLVDPTRDLALQIGSFPGAFRVWVNGVKVRESGFLSTDPGRFRANGVGGLVTVQPRDGVLELVVEMVTDDWLVLHSELNRVWMLGPSELLLAAHRAETNWRSLQTTILLLGLLAFFWISRFRNERWALLVFIAFLAVCLAKLLFNVEQPEPLLAPLLPGIPLSVYLFLNHALNLVPFPLFVLFLNRQFPEDVDLRAVVVVTVATLVVTVWEVLPFAALALGQVDVYRAVMKAAWSTILNVWVVTVVLFIFERFYHLFARRRPLSGSLFFGGIVLGLIILLPIPLSFFFPVKYTYFLGWGMFFYLLILCVDLIRLQIELAEARVLRLTETLERRETLSHFVAPGWAGWLGKESTEDLRPGDWRSTEALLVQISSRGAADQWLPFVGPVAVARKAVLVDWRDGTGTWALDAWSETALAFGLEVQRRFEAGAVSDYRIVLTRAAVEFQIYNLDTVWLPAVTGLPVDRLDELHERAQAYGARLVLDATLQDGLVIGGWRRHRHLTVSGTEIELYEAEEETLAQLKDKTLDAFEEGLALARSERLEEAAQALFSVVRHNPFDQAARALLDEWESRLSP